MNTTDFSDLEVFFEHSPDLICVAGFDGYFRKINSAVCNTLGYTRAELFLAPISSFIYSEDKHVTAMRRKKILTGEALTNFDNRYVTKTGELVWLTWTSVPIPNKELVFAIAKNITYRKKLEEYKRIASILIHAEDSNEKQEDVAEGPITLSAADQLWLSEVEKLIRRYSGTIDITVAMLGNELAMSERQLFRRIKTILGLTPNRYIRIIKLQIAKEALKTGKFRTISEISFLAGFKTPAYFNRLFRDVYGSDIAELM
jgi:PAS domain S-box-containing protein